MFFKRKFKPIDLVFTLFKEAFTEWQKDKASQLAAALAYYTVFSLAPLLIITIAIAGTFFGQQAARGEILTQIQDLVGTSGAEVIETLLNNANQPELKSFASLISLVVLFIGASGVFAQLQDALNQVWNVKSKPKGGIFQLIRKRVLSFAMVLIIGFLLLISLILSTALSALINMGDNFLLGLDFILSSLNFLLSFGLITVLFASIYKFLPDVSIAWKDVWVGAIITALLFTVGNSLLGVYLGTSSFGSAYGAAGSFVILLAWVYYSAQILLFGAELTQIFARKFGSKILPKKYAKPTLPNETEKLGSG